jgi:cytochrome c-type biogenesis protein
MNVREVIILSVSYSIALFTGLLSFFSPCILPLLPVYFGYLTGEAATNINNPKIKRRLIINAVGFVLGISLLNVLLGFGAKAFTKVLIDYGDVLRIIGGILMIAFGFYFVSGMKWLYLEKERKVQYKNYTPTFLKSFILGIAFNFGWTPCNGPIIASILIVSSFEQDYLRAGTLMLIYSLGFSMMFLVSAILIGLFIEKVKRIYPYLNTIKRISGVVMIIMGTLLITNLISRLNIT